MAISEQDIICLSCKYRKFDLVEGLLCSITNNKSDFEISCINFIDETEIRKTENSRILINQQKSEKGRKKFIIYSGIYIFINLLVVLISLFNSGNYFIHLLGLLLNILFLYYIHNGKNWVRILFTIFIVFSLIQFGIVELIVDGNDFNVTGFVILNSCFVYQIYLLFIDSDFRVFFKQQRILNQR
jgi:hypothetical protein